MIPRKKPESERDPSLPETADELSGARVRPDVSSPTGARPVRLYGEDDEDEVTVVRRWRVPAKAIPPSSRRTTRMVAVDARLLAVARGDAEPDAEDPFGGLIPVYEDDDLVAVEADPVVAIDEGWSFADLLRDEEG